MAAGRELRVCWEACDSGRSVMRLPDANDITFSQTKKVFFFYLICCRKLYYKKDKRIYKKKRKNNRDLFLRACLP